MNGVASVQASEGASVSGPATVVIGEVIIDLTLEPEAVVEAIDLYSASGDRPFRSVYLRYADGRRGIGDIPNELAVDVGNVLDLLYGTWSRAPGEVKRLVLAVRNRTTGRWEAHRPHCEWAVLGVTHGLNWDRILNGSGRFGLAAKILWALVLGLPMALPLVTLLVVADPIALGLAGAPIAVSAAGATCLVVWSRRRREAKVRALVRRIQECYRG